METNLNYSKYALITRQIELTSCELLHSDVDSNVNKYPNTHSDKLLVEPGALIKIIGTPDGNESDKNIVQIIDFKKNSYTNTYFYECKTSNLVKVAEALWPYVISIVNLERRLRLVCNKEKCLWLINLKVDDLLSVQGELFKRKNAYFDCILRYIGPVPELNPVGYFFGLEILHLNNGHSPQAKDIPFANKYMPCEPSLSIFATADWIVPIPNEFKHKLSARKLLNETCERVYSAFGPVVNTTQKKRQPTSQFYDSTPLIAKSPAKHDPETMAESLDSEDCTKSNNKELKPTSVERKSTNHFNAKDATGFRKNTFNASDTMNIKDRDIIVINKSDIEESTKNEHNVIIVNNPQEKENVDLADLLGSNWPTNAGGAAMILNRPHAAAKATDNNLEKPTSHGNFARNKEDFTQKVLSPVDVKTTARPRSTQPIKI